MYTEPGYASQYLSTTLRIPPNPSPDADRYFASDSSLTMITIADPRLFPVFCCSLSRFSFISQRGKAFNFMPIDDYTSCLSSSIFPSPHCLSSDIPCTFRCYQCSSISTPIIAASTVFAAQISAFDSQRINDPALAFLDNSADTAPVGKYRIRENCISTPSPAFANASFRTSMRSASDICRSVVSRGKRILLP